MEQNIITCYFDGCCEPTNPGGNMGLGAWAHFGSDQLFEHSEMIRAKFTNSNNVAEYMAFEKLLIWLSTEDKLIDICGRDVIIYGDSKLVIMQMQKLWKIKGGRYVNIANECFKQLTFVKDLGFKVSLEWIPREENDRADDLSKKHLLQNGVVFRLQPQKK